MGGLFSNRIVSSVVRKVSMEPKFCERDRVISFRIRSAGCIKRGNIVIFREKSSSDFKFKRVIGLPGERFKIVNGDIYVNDILLAGGWKIKGDISNYRCISIPANHYFLMGDNRSVSEDSRDFGPVHINNILYKSHIVYWPIRHFKILI
jgi:signal peptidase I